MTDEDWARLRQEANALRTLADDVAGRAKALVTNGLIDETAEAELRSYLTSGSDYLESDEDFVTPAMRLLENRLAAPFDTWLQTAASVVARIEAEERRATNDELGMPTEQALEAQATAQRHEIGAKERAKPPFVEASAALNAAQVRYAELKSYNDDREARRIPRAVFVLGLLAVGAGEWYVNYETFVQRLPRLLALIAVIAVAFIVAINSDHIGKWWKQKRIASVMPSERVHLWPLLASSAAFIFAMVLVLWARYSYYAEIYGLGAQNVLGGADAGAGALVLSRVVPTIGFNFLIWFIGIMWAFWFYERVPHLRDSLRDIDKHRQKLAQVEGRIQKAVAALDQRLGIERERANSQRSNLKNRAAQAREEKQGLEKQAKTMAQRRAVFCKQLFKDYALRFGASSDQDPSEIAIRSRRGAVLGLMEFRNHSFSGETQ